MRDNSANVSSQLNQTRHQVDMIDMMIQLLREDLTQLREQVGRRSFSTGVLATVCSHCCCFSDVVRNFDLLQAWSNTNKIWSWSCNVTKVLDDMMLIT